jgi:hypothetical protein
MSWKDVVLKLFNGNETARAMRYSISVMLIALTAGYVHILSADTVTAVMMASTGYIFGKAKAHTEIIETKERRKD